jgi:hypothetical protein
MSISTLFSEEALVDAAVAQFRRRVRDDILAKLRADVEAELLPIAEAAATSVTARLHQYVSQRTFASHLDWQVTVNGAPVHTDSSQ